MLITQTTEFRSVCRPRTMDGIAMDTIVVSSRIMKNPMHSATSAAHGLTCLVTILPLYVHNGQLGRRDRLPGRPPDPPRLEIVDQLLGPVQFGLTLVVDVRVVDPVHLRQ